MEASRPRGNFFIRFFHALLGCFCFFPNIPSDSDTPCQATETSSASGTSPRHAETRTSIGTTPRQSKTPSSHGTPPRPTETPSSTGTSQRHTKKSSSHGPSQEQTKKSSSHGTSQQQTKKSCSHGPSQEQTKKSSSHGTSQQQTKKSCSHGPSQQQRKKSSSHKPSQEQAKKSFLEGSTVHFSNASTDYGCEEEQTGYPMFGIKRFKFYQELGRGAFGKVMLAQDTVIGDLLAMKVVKKSKYVTHPDSAMMERRILALANDCPFLTHSRCAFQTQEHLIYAMEFVSGGTLRQYIKRNKSLSISMTQFFSAEIVSGIRFLHRNSIVHRDLKTDNILVDRNGHIKIADFGLAIEDLYEDEETVGFAGTVGYAAPEMLGDYYYNSSVDWWSLGIIIFEMATGETPFWGEDCESLIKDVEALVYPDFFSHEMTDLLQKLWTIDQVLRLELAQDILSHPFFNDIEWEDLELQLTAPPVRPDPTYTLSRLECLLMSQGSNVSSSEEQTTPLSPQDQALFSGFSFVHPNWN